MVDSFALPVILVHSDADINYEMYRQKSNISIIEPQYASLFPKKAKGPKIWIMGREYTILDYQNLIFTRDFNEIYESHKANDLSHDIAKGLWHIQSKSRRKKIDSVKPLIQNTEFPQGIAIRLRRDYEKDLIKSLWNIFKIAIEEKSQKEDIDFQDLDKYKLEYFFYDIPSELLNASNCIDIVNNLDKIKLKMGIALFMHPNARSSIVHQIIGYPTALIAQGWIGIIPIFNNMISPTYPQGNTLLLFKSTQVVSLVNTECCKSEYEVLLTPIKEIYNSEIGPRINEVSIAETALISTINPIISPIMLDPYSFNLAMFESNKIDIYTTLLIELLSRNPEESISQHSLLKGINIAYKLHKIDEVIEALTKYVNFAYKNEDILQPRTNLLYWIIKNSKEYEMNREYTVYLKNLINIDKSSFIASDNIRRIILQNRTEFTFAISTKFVSSVFGDINVELPGDLSISSDTTLTSWAYVLKRLYTYWNMFEVLPISNLIVQVGRKSTENDFFEDTEFEDEEIEFQIDDNIADVFATMTFKRGTRNPLDYADSYISYISRNDTLIRELFNIMKESSNEFQKVNRKVQRENKSKSVLWLLNSLKNPSHPIYKVGRFSLLLIGRKPHVII